MRDPHLLIAAVITGAYCLGVIYIEAQSKRLAGPVGLWAGLTIVHFALPGAVYAWDPDYFFEYQPNSQWATESMIFTLLAFMAYQFGVWFVAQRSSTDLSGAPDTSYEEWTAAGVIGVAVVLFVVGWLTRFYIIKNDAYFQVTRTFQGDLEGPFYAWIRFAEAFPLHVLCILSIHVWHPMRERPKGWLYALIGVELLELVYWGPTGRKEEPILVLLLPMLIRYVQVNRLPSKVTIVGFAAFIVVLFPITRFYRWALESYGGLGRDVFSIATLAISVLEHSSGETFEVIFGVSIFESMLARFALIESVSACMRLINTGQWDLFLGRSYGEGLLGLIPRLIWPSKPDLHYGTEFGQAAGFLKWYDWLTSISVTFVGEAYLNFGWLGVTPLMLIGMLFGSVYEHAKRSQHRQTWTLLYTMTLETILFVGGTFGLHFGGLLKIWPIYFLISLLMRRGLRIKREQPLLVPR